MTIVASAPDWLRLSAVVSAVALLVVWVGYPFLMRGLASILGHHHSGEPGYQPRVSIVIATRNNPGEVRAKVFSCLNTEYPIELIEVVIGWDVGSWRDVPPLDLPAGLPVRSVLGRAPGGKAATLNAAVESAAGELLIMADTHQHFTPRTIPELVASMSDQRFGAVSGALELEATSRNTLIGWYWRYERSLRAAEAKVHSTIGVSGSLYAMRRELWKPLPPRLILDDLYVPLRLIMGGNRVGFNEKALAMETRVATPHQEFQRKVRTLAGNVQLCAWLPEILIPLRNPVWPEFVLHKLLRLLTPVWVLVVVAYLVTLAWLAISNGDQYKVLGVVAIMTALLLLPTRPTRLLREMITWAATMQAAVVVGAAKGLRGEWDIWD
jgi:biofilm PGA synthesis N-glycosyltransferase PgaC